MEIMDAFLLYPAPHSPPAPQVLSECVHPTQRGAAGGYMAVMLNVGNLGAIFILLF